METKTKSKKTAGANAKKLYFWIQFHKNDEKKWLFLYVPAEAGDDEEELADFLVNNQHIFGLQSEIEPQAYGAYNWEIVRIADVVYDFSTTTEFDYEFTQSPEEIEHENRLVKFEKKGIEKYSLTDKDIEFDEKTAELIITNLPHGNLKMPISKIYDLIEKEIDGDVELTNYKGETVLTLVRGSFLNVGVADIKVFGNRKDAEEYSIMNQTQKGGIFIRERGVIDIGNTEQTKYLSINLANLIRELQNKGLLRGAVKGEIDFRQTLQLGEGKKNDNE